MADRVVLADFGGSGPATATGWTAEQSAAGVFAGAVDVGRREPLFPTAAGDSSQGRSVAW